MSNIKSKDTKPEQIVRRYLFAQGFRFRKNDKRFPGKPDVVLPKYKTVVFIHGCFWHGHEGCKYYSPPKSRTDFWIKKVAYNKSRDATNISDLTSMGWNVLIVWECELKQDQTGTLERLCKQLLVLPPE